MPPPSRAELDGAPGNAAAGRTKKKKTESQGQEEGKKLGAFARVWSAADEVRILECLADHVRAHGAGPTPGAAKLRAMLAGRALDKADFTASQIYEKVRRLRERYDKLRSTAGAGAGAGAPAQDEDARMLELSKVIWGDSPAPPQVIIGASDSDAAPEPDTRVRAHTGLELGLGFEELLGLYPSLAVAVDWIAVAVAVEEGTTAASLKRALQLMDDGKAGELDAMVKKQRISEVKTMLDCDSLRCKVRKALVKYMV